MSPLRVRGSLLGRYEPREIGRTHAWLVVYDPECTFTDRLFQLQDLDAGARSQTWPDGIRFVNIFSEQCKIYKDGELRDE